MKSNILLTGFMGAGKSSTARVLAHETGLFAIDTDDLIESYINCSISSLFATQGEAAFRQLEQHVANWIEASVQHTIISTGGGFFMVNNLLRLGLVIFLHCDFDVIHQRLLSHPAPHQQFAKRPLFQDIDEARKRFDTRLPRYREHAHHEINTSGKKAKEVLHEIKVLAEKNGVFSSI